MYIGASDLCNRIVIDMDQDLQYTRLWDIKAEYSALKTPLLMVFGRGSFNLLLLKSEPPLLLWTNPDFCQDELKEPFPYARKELVES